MFEASETQGPFRHLPIGGESPGTVISDGMFGGEYEEPHSALSDIDADSTLITASDDGAESDLPPQVRAADEQPAPESEPIGSSVEPTAENGDGPPLLWAASSEAAVPAEQQADSLGDSTEDEIAEPPALPPAAAGAAAVAVAAASESEPDVTQTAPADATLPVTPADGPIPQGELTEPGAIPVAEANEPATVQEQVTTVLTLDDTEFAAQRDDFIAERLAAIQPTEPVPERFGFLEGTHQGFLTEETALIPQGTSGSTIILDDPGIYAPALDWGKEIYGRLIKQGKEPDVAYRTAAVYAAQFAQQDYFGNVHNSSEASAERERMVWEGVILGSEGQTYSIADFKGRAACMERAAVANNVMQFYGFSPVLEVGEMQYGDNPRELHAWLTIKNSQGLEMAFDVTNPHLSLLPDGALQTKPALYPVNPTASTRTMTVTGVRQEAGIVDGAHVHLDVPVRFKTGDDGRELHPS
ncbi:MAG TPA: hypothetical protein VGO07_00420 [Candidatus Saccharimonadales bacterium]|nr:hypothetical protein [Candidatus Saccharimonadales bacterium]